MSLQLISFFLRNIASYLLTDLLEGHLFKKLKLPCRLVVSI